MEKLNENAVLKIKIQNDELDFCIDSYTKGSRRKAIIELLKKSEQCENTILCRDSWIGTYGEGKLTFGKDGVFKWQDLNWKITGIFIVEENKIHLKHILTSTGDWRKPIYPDNDRDVKTEEGTVQINPQNYKELTFLNTIYRPVHYSYFPSKIPLTLSHEWKGFYNNCRKLTALGKLMIDSREPKHNFFSKSDNDSDNITIIRFVYDETIVKCLNRGNDFIMGTKFSYTFFAIGTCYYESHQHNGEQTALYGNYFINSDNDIQVNLLSKEDFNNSDGNEKIMTNSLKFDPLYIELQDGSRLFKYLAFST